MNIDKNMVVAGQPIKAVRDFLRQHADSRFTIDAVKEHFGIDDRKAKALVKEAKAQHWIGPAKGYPGAIQATEEGRRLINTRFVKRLSRAKADALFAEFMRRVEEVNANDELSHRVVEIKLFGSYITDAPEVGDIDILYRLEIRNKNEKPTEASYRRAQANGARPRNFLDLMTYGPTEVKKLLAARSPYLALHSMELDGQLDTPMRRVYPPEGS